LLESLMKAAAFTARRARGITLIECVIALVILAALMSIALPSFADAMARARLRGAAEDLALGLGNARLESVRAGVGKVHVTVAPGSNWCWSVGPVAAVDCTNPPVGSTIHTVRGEAYPGITMSRGVSASFDGRDTLAAAGFAAEFVSSHGGALRVHVTPLGRASICAPQGRSLDYPRCT
jgi:type IV fimbrial biogenesis protein FimT